MKVVRHMRKLDYFLTFTTLLNCPKIRKTQLQGEKQSDRLDICEKMFKIKHSLMEVMSKKKQNKYWIKLELNHQPLSGRREV